VELMGKGKGTTQVMYIAKLKDGSKSVKKTFSMILERVFEIVWWRGRKWNHIKRIFEVEVFFSSKNIDFPFYLKSLLEHFFFLFFMLRPMRTWGFRWYLRRKSLLEKLIFKWLQYTSGGHIF
jgi:hypothetical protein